jgi:membrane-associated protein
MQFIFDFILHIDEHLVDLMNQYGTLIYVILFLIVFCETGLVVTPFLPGDSLLFAAGALAAAGNMNVGVLIIIFLAAAILGNTSNFLIGRYIGPRLFEQGKFKFINRDYLLRTQAFYAKHGGKAIIISRFIPIFRTFVPFVAGIGKMDTAKFSLYNISSGFLWVVPVTLAGYFFGNIPLVKNNFSLVVLLIIGISVLPAIIAAIREAMRKRKNVEAPKE